MRSPYTQKYEPGSVTDAVPLEDHATFKDVEKTVTADLPAQFNYAKLCQDVLWRRHGQLLLAHGG